MRFLRVDPLQREDVAVPGQSRGRNGLRRGQKRFDRGDRFGAPVVQDGHARTEQPDFVARMRNEQDVAGIGCKHVLQFPHQLPFQKAVECGKRFVQKQQLRLPAGERFRVLLRDVRKLIGSERGLHNRTPFGAGTAANAGKNVLLHGHVREQRVLLKQVADVSLLRREADASLAVEQDAPVQNDTPLVRPHRTGDALQRNAFAASGRAEQTERRPVGFQSDRKAEVAEFLFNGYRKRHGYALLPPRRCRRSKRFMTSRTTAEIAMFTNTHFSASASSFVRQSW